MDSSFRAETMEDCFVAALLAMTVVSVIACDAKQFRRDRAITAGLAECDRFAKVPR
jgi:hypothetical protein